MLKIMKGTEVAATLYRVIDTGYDAKFVIASVDWGSAPVNLETLQSANKELYCYSSIGGRDVTLGIWVLANSSSQMLTRKKELISAVPLRTAITLIDGDNGDREITAYASEGFSWSNTYGENNDKVAKATIVLRCPDPTFSDGTI